MSAVPGSDPVPDRFRGAWRRVSLAVDGGAPAEHADVVWLQAERTYAGLRIPRYGYGDIVPPTSSAGTTTWSDPFLRRSHDLDLDRGPDRSPRDGAAGRVRWDGDDLVETSEFLADGRVISSTAVWRRVAGSGCELESHWSPDGTCVVVRTGDHVLTIADDRPRGGSYRACYRTRHEGRWAVELALGAGATDLPAPPSREEKDPARGLPTP